MKNTIYLGLILVVTVTTATTAATMAAINTVPEVYASAGCSPPIEDPENEDFLIERCEGHSNSIDKETGEEIGSGSDQGEGITKTCLNNEFMEERFLNTCIRG
jgi:hypothetical protein